MKEFAPCTKCKSLTTPKESGLCVKCECFAEIDSGLPFRTKSERPPFHANVRDGNSCAGIMISRVLCCGTGTPLPSDVSESDLDKPIEAIIYEQSLLDQLKLESSSDSNTSA